MRWNQKTNSFALACVAGCFLVSASPQADVLFFLLDEGGQGAWEAALNVQRQEVYEAFNTTGVWGDPGIVGMDGPEFVGDIGMDSNLNPFGVGGRAGRGAGGNGLDLIGASAGFGNADTAMVAGFFVDGLDIFSVGEFPTAMELRVTSFLGSNTVAVTVYDPNENAIAQLPSVVATTVGSRLGILATDGDVIGRINIFDNAGGGAEGFSGDLITYINGPPVAAVLIDFEIETGVLLRGDINDLRESDDEYVHTHSGFGQRFSETHLMDIVISARTDESVRRGLNLAIESRISDSGGVAKVRLRNWRTGVFEQVGQYSIGLNEETITFEDIDTTDYVRTSGAVELSIKHVVFVPFLAFRFDSFLDLVEITVD